MKLPPYLETTALTLIALQDHRDDPSNRRAYDTLQRMLPDAASGLTLSWAILCLRVHGADVSRWLAGLGDAYARTGFQGEEKPAALALMAAGDRARAFQVA